MPGFVFRGFIGGDYRVAEGKLPRLIYRQRIYRRFFLFLCCIPDQALEAAYRSGSDFLVGSALRNGASGQIFRSGNNTFGARLVGYGRGVCWNR